MPASQDSHWATPQTIPGYHPETWPPILVADQNRTVHAFSSQWIGEESGESLRAIVYNRWTLEQGWTTPTDIILSPNKDARITDVYLDKNGIFHLVFFGGDNTYADIYYSKAHAALADDAHAWSVPLVIGENAGDPEGAAFGESDQGALYVVYSGREFGNGLYFVNSKDGGETWSDPTPIFFALPDEPNITELEVIKSKSGWLHASWAVNNISGQGRGIFYIRSQDGNEWSEPVLLADAQEDLGTQTPTIFEHDNTLFVLYITHLNQHNKMVMRQSRDEGKTWNDQAMIFPRHEGVNGLLSLVTDSNNELHLFFGQRTQVPEGPAIHGMWHSIFVNNRWIEPEGIIRGYKVLDKEGYDSFDPNSARSVVSQGNVILVTWRSDPGSKGNGVWFSYKKMDAPELPIVQLSAPPISHPAASPGPTLVEDFSAIKPLPTNKPLSSDLLDDNPSSNSVGRVFGGVALVVFFFLVAFLSFVRKR